MNRTDVDDAVNDKIYNALIDFYNLLGDSVVLLPVPLGSKSPNKKNWQRIRYKDTQQDEYLCDLINAVEHGGNIGVLLTDGLTTIDCDSDEFAEEMIHLNPSQ